MVLLRSSTYLLLAANIVRFLMQLWFLKCGSTFEKTLWIRSSYEFIMWQKFMGYVMNPVVVSTANFSLSMFNNCFENTSAFWSCCKNTHIWNVFICLQKLDDFKHAFSSWATFDRVKTGRVWRQYVSNYYTLVYEVARCTFDWLRRSMSARLLLGIGKNKSKASPRVTLKYNDRSK